MLVRAYHNEFPNLTVILEIDDDILSMRIIEIDFITKTKHTCARSIPASPRAIFSYPRDKGKTD